MLRWICSRCLHCHKISSLSIKRRRPLLKLHIIYSQFITRNLVFQEGVFICGITNLTVKSLFLGRPVKVRLPHSFTEKIWGMFMADIDILGIPKKSFGDKLLILSLTNQPQLFQLPGMVRTAGNQIDAGRLDRAVTKKVSQLHHITANLVKRPGKEVPKIMGEKPWWAQSPPVRTAPSFPPIFVSGTARSCFW